MLGCSGRILYLCQRLLIYTQINNKLTMMKKQFLMAAMIAGLVCTGCTQDEPEKVRVITIDNSQSPDWDGTDTITISFTRAFNISTSPMTTRANMESVVSRIDLWLIQGTDTTTISQAQGDEGFGTFTMAVNRQKEYTLKAVGHKGSKALTMNQGVIAFDPAEKMTHSFYTAHTFKPDTITGGSLQLKTDRMVGQLVFATTDSVPSKVKTMRFKIKQVPSKFDTSTLTGTDLRDRTVDFTSISRKTDGSAQFVVYILPEDMTQQHSYDVVVSALDAQGGTIESREFKDVPFRADYKCQYSGAFFVTRGLAFSFSIGDWKEIDGVSF